MKAISQLQSSRQPLKCRNPSFSCITSTQKRRPRSLSGTQNFDSLDIRYFSALSKRNQPNTRRNLRQSEEHTRHEISILGNLLSGQKKKSFSSSYFAETRHDALRLARTNTKELTEMPIGSWTPTQWKDAISTLRSWTKRDGHLYGTAESVLESFSLLERALLEQKQGKASLKLKIAAHGSLDTDLLNSVIGTWSTCWVQIHHDSNARAETSYNEAEKLAKLLLEFSFENVLSRIDTYRIRSSGLLVPNRKTYLLLKDAAQASYKSGNQSSFALDLLERMAKEDHLTLDCKVYTKFIKACARLGDAEQAEKCLELMYNHFERSGSKKLKPDTVSFNLVLLAWSHSSDAQFASQRSQAILKRMQELSRKGGALEGAVIPSYMSYSLVLRCLSKWLSSLALTSMNAEKAKDYQNVGERAEELLQEMDARAAKGDHTVKPNAVVYNIVLHILSLLGNAEKCEKLLQIMYDDFRNQGNKQAEPNVYSFTTVISAWKNYQKIKGLTSTSVTSSKDVRQTTSDVGERAEAILRRMQELSDSGELKNAEPDLQSYTAALQCWANTRSPEAGSRAEAIVRQIEKKSKEEDKQLLSSVSYSAVLQAYAGAGDAKGAEAFLGRLVGSFRSGDDTAKPLVQYLTILLNAWSRSNDPQAPLRAEELLREMWSLWEEGILDGQPNVVSYSTVLDCFAKSSLPDAGERAEKLLDEMSVRAARGDEKLRPNTISYRNTINAYSRIGNVDKAEELVERMFDDYRRQGNINAKPNLKVLNLILAAHANSNKPDKAKRAEAYLRYMQDLYDRKLLDDKVDVVSYTLVLKCIANSNYENAGEEAKRLINEMEERADLEKDERLRPNTMTYSTAIQAYSRAGQPQEAELMLDRMYKSFQNGNKEAMPNSRTFTNILKAWCSQMEGVDRALAILDWMKDIQTTGSLPDVKVNMIHYAVCLGGLARKRQHSAAEKAVSLLKEMENAAAAGDKDVMPNDVCYNNAINAFATIGDAQRAQELVAQMYHSYREGWASHQPSIATWNILLGAWSRSSDPQAALKAEAVVKRMHELYASGTLSEKPNSITYTTLLCCWAASKDRDRTARVESLLDRVDELRKVGNDTLFKEMYDYTLAIRVLCQMKDDKLTARAELLLRRMIKEFDRSTPKWKSVTAGAFHAIISTWAKSRDPNCVERGERLKREMLQLLPHIR